MPIRILDESTVNKIAAGEVIERPASALKELLENSADSGATKIEIDFDLGGKKYLKVSDNGSGMTLDELPLALARHATSKIETADDLERLNTFGFRGEALASLAGVSKLTLQSGKKKSSSGSQIISQGGKLEGPKPFAPLEGTNVLVEDLFFNIPARLKFLKSDGAETGAIKRTVKAFALSHPETTVILRQGQKLLFHCPAQDFLKRACQIMELKESQVVFLDHEDSGMKLRGVLGLPEVNVATQQGLWIFVQGRPVVDRSLQFAVMEGYKNLVMHHQYPQAVLWLTVDPKEVDVNVHPTKAQVKFLDTSSVFRFVSRQVREALAKKLEVSPSPSSYFESSATFQPELIRDAVTQYNQRQIYQEPTEQKVDSSPSPLPSRSPGLSHSANTEKSSWGSLQLIGQYANTYLVCQSHNSLVLVDQHASHERVLFELLKKQSENGSTLEKQMSLLEELIELSPEAIEILRSEKHLALLNSLGFEFFERGPETLAVSARPSFLIDVSLKPLFERLTEQLLEVNETTTIQDLKGEIWASMACHGAIRAGRVLSSEEMKSLLVQMDEFAFSSFCPHGRPVSVKLGLTELEKLFKRIV